MNGYALSLSFYSLPTSESNSRSHSFMLSGHNWCPTRSRIRGKCRFYLHLTFHNQYKWSIEYALARVANQRFRLRLPVRSRINRRIHAPSQVQALYWLPHLPGYYRLWTLPLRSRCCLPRLAWLPCYQQNTTQSVLVEKLAFQETRETCDPWEQQMDGDARLSQPRRQRCQAGLTCHLSNPDNVCREITAIMLEPLHQWSMEDSMRGNVTTSTKIWNSSDVPCTIRILPMPYRKYFCFTSIDDFGA